MEDHGLDIPRSLEICITVKELLEVPAGNIVDVVALIKNETEVKKLDKENKIKEVFFFDPEAEVEVPV